MKTANKTEIGASEQILDGRQVDDKPKRRVRSGEGTLAYWKDRLFRNTYTGADGNKVEIPEWYVRLRFDGETRRVRLHTAEKEAAAAEALSLSGRLSKEGWRAVEMGQARLQATESIDSFCETYREVSKGLERPPRDISVDNYVRSLKQFAALAGVATLRQLRPEVIEGAREKYRRQARAKKRVASAIENTFAKILRNSAACFSREMLVALKRRGIVVQNPFADVKKGIEIKPVVPLPESVLQRIEKEVPVLRDGDASAADPSVLPFVASHRKKHGRKPQWRAIDFRQPHPEAYVAVLLALKAGLRANEIDKARWSWFRNDGKGWILTIAEEEDFTPKGGGQRSIRLATDLYEAIAATRKDASIYMLGERTARPSYSVADGVITVGPKKKSKEHYRRPEVLRTAALWLRLRGLKDASPLHRLRKQFGSTVATAHNLFVAQKYLGHSSPVVTAKHYAGLVGLPEVGRLTG